MGFETIHYQSLICVNISGMDVAFLLHGDNFFNDSMGRGSAGAYCLTAGLDEGK